MQITLIHASSSTQTTDPPACVTSRGGTGLGGFAGQPGGGADSLILYDLDVISDSAFTHIRRLSAHRKVLVLAGPVTGPCLWGLFRAGASGLILRDSAIRVLGRALMEVSLGGIYLDPSLSTAGQDSTDPATILPGLTQRERDVLRLMARGFTNRQMAAALMISVRTVETHRANLQRKLGAQGRSEVILLAEQLGWLDEHKRYFP